MDFEIQNTPFEIQNMAETLPQLVISHNYWLKKNNTGRRLNLYDVSLRFYDRLKGYNLRKAIIIKSDLRKTDLREVNFSKAILSESDLSNARAKESCFKKADMSYTKCISTNFDYADLSNVDLYHADLRNASFKSACLSGASLTRANLENVNFKDADLTGADLSYARVKGADFTKASLYGAILPVGFYQVNIYLDKFNSECPGLKYLVCITWDSINDVVICPQCPKWSPSLAEFESEVNKVYGKGGEKYNPRIFTLYMDAVSYFKGIHCKRK